MQLASQPGISTWYLQFGYHDSQFELLLSGWATAPGTGGTRLTPWYRFANKESELIGRNDGLRGLGRVPAPFASNWLNAWSNLITEQNVPKEIGQIIVSQGSGGAGPALSPISAYNFSLSDVVGVARLTSDNVPDAVYFCLLNHTNEVAQQSKHPGLLGVALVTMHIESGDTPMPISFYYDISSPCPPGCLSS